MVYQRYGTRMGSIARMALTLAVLALSAGRVACAADAVARVALTRVDPAVASAKALVGRLPSIGTFKHADLLHISAAGGSLSAEIMPAARRNGQFRCKVEGSEADWVITYREITLAGRPMTQSLVVQRYDFAQIDAGGIWSSTLSIRADAVISMDGRAGSGTDYGRVTVTTVGGALRLQVFGRKLAPDGKTIIVQGNSYRDLRSKAPKPFRQHLLPMVRGFCGEDVFAAGAGDVYRAWPEMPADERVVEQVRQVLPVMDSPLPSERAAASQRLTELGAQGVLAALRIDRAPLSPEQAGRLNAHIARHEHRGFITAQEARSDAWFLIDCLEFDDPVVRKLAAEDLSRLWGRPIAFDVDAPAGKRAELADALRDMASARPFTPATTPATQPGAPHIPFVPRPVASE